MCRARASRSIIFRCLCCAELFHLDHVGEGEEGIDPLEKLGYYCKVQQIERKLVSHVKLRCEILNLLAEVEDKAVEQGYHSAKKGAEHGDDDGFVIGRSHMLSPEELP